MLSLAYEGARAHPKRVLFAEGEDEVVLRAAIPSATAATARRCWSVATTCPTGWSALGVTDPDSYEVHNSRTSPLVPRMVDFLYERLQRRGYLRRDWSG